MGFTRNGASGKFRGTNKHNGGPISNSGSASRFVPKVPKGGRQLTPGKMPKGMVSPYGKKNGR